MYKRQSFIIHDKYKNLILSTPDIKDDSFECRFSNLESKITYYIKLICFLELGESVSTDNYLKSNCYIHLKFVKYLIKRKMKIFSFDTNFNINYNINKYLNAWKRQSHFIENIRNFNDIINERIAS